ncbi:MAG: hypothetical protein SPH62_01150 [Candidatus Egerieousia sp.]|nr:hypothetical protein [bacterium]MDY5255006.1 hypothetical protein [Candidatus Egerieousia sp.]
MRFVAGQGSRYGGAVAGQGAVAELHREDATAPREPVAPSEELAAPLEPSGTIGKMLPSMAQQRCHREDAACWGSC